MEYLKLNKENHVATITLSSPPANALSSKVLKDLYHAFDDIEHDESIKVIVIHGEGRFFSAGADIKEFTTVESEADFAQLSSYGQRLFNRMNEFKKPIIAAIHGAALGGGLELAMACHIRLVTEKAKLGLPELTLGLIPGFAGTQRLPRYVGVAKASEMMLTGQPISGVEAVQLGLANHAYTDEDIFDQAFELAQKIAEKSAVSIACALECLKYAKDGNFQQGVAKEAELFGKVFVSEDAKEGIQAFLEKRKPQFKDR